MAFRSFSPRLLRVFLTFPGSPDAGNTKGSGCSVSVVGGSTLEGSGSDGSLEMSVCSTLEVDWMGSWGFKLVSGSFKGRLESFFCCFTSILRDLRYFLRAFR